MGQACLPSTFTSPAAGSCNGCGPDAGEPRYNLQLRAPTLQQHPHRSSAAELPLFDRVDFDVCRMLPELLH